MKLIPIIVIYSTFASTRNLAQRRKASSTINYKRLTINYSFATRLWQARNDCGLLRIGRRTQRKLRNFTVRGNFNYELLITNTLLGSKERWGSLRCSPHCKFPCGLGGAHAEHALLRCWTRWGACRACFITLSASFMQCGARASLLVLCCRVPPP